MTRLIDADVLKKYIDDCKCCEKCSNRMRNCNEDCELPDFLTRQWERVIDEQPTVEAKPKWIPVSERMPKEGKNVLVTVQYHWHTEVDIDMYVCGEWVDYVGGIIAWAELPKGYEE